jgi:hypothetical protein
MNKKTIDIILYFMYHFNRCGLVFVNNLFIFTVSLQILNIFGYFTVLYTEATQIGSSQNAFI